MTVMVERHMNRTVRRTNPDRDRIMGIVAQEIVIRKANDFPRTAWKLASADTYAPVSVVIPHVLEVLVGDDGILLKREAVDRLTKISVDREGMRIDERNVPLDAAKIVGDCG
jgi:hypothetical protein